MYHTTSAADSEAVSKWKRYCLQWVTTETFSFFFTVSGLVFSSLRHTADDVDGKFWIQKQMVRAKATQEGDKTGQWYLQWQRETR